MEEEGRGAERVLRDGLDTDERMDVVERCEEREGDEGRETERGAREELELEERLGGGAERAEGAERPDRGAGRPAPQTPVVVSKKAKSTTMAKIRWGYPGMRRITDLLASTYHLRAWPVGPGILSLRGMPFMIGQISSRSHGNFI